MPRGLRRLLRVLSMLAVVAGLGTLAWAVLTWQWEDPFTSVYTQLEQRKLADRYEGRAAEFARARPEKSARPSGSAIRRQARRYRRNSQQGAAVGRISIPRIGLKMILLNGTDEDTLKRGPGRYLGSFMPGEGQLIYVAGHRTTYSAPFSNIDALRPGDRVTLEVPYGTFEYRVARSVIVGPSQTDVLRSHGREVLALQSCHPRFFATHRYITYARPVRVRPTGASASIPAREFELAAAAAPSVS
jgi:sortase A